jgi:hypothetical protein
MPGRRMSCKHPPPPPHPVPGLDPSGQCSAWLQPFRFSPWPSRARFHVSKAYARRLGLRLGPGVVVAAAWAPARRARSAGGFAWHRFVPRKREACRHPPPLTKCALSSPHPLPGTLVALVTLIVLEQVVMHLRRRTASGSRLPGPAFVMPFLGGLLSMVHRPEWWWELQRLYMPKGGLSANYMLGKMMVFSTDNTVNRAVLVRGLVSECVCVGGGGYAGRCLPGTLPLPGTPLLPTHKSAPIFHPWPLYVVAEQSKNGPNGFWMALHPNAGTESGPWGTLLGSCRTVTCFKGCLGGDCWGGGML